MSKDSLTITDNRTGKSYEIPIQEGTVKAIDLRQIKVSAEEFGLMTYDPAFTNTASCKSRITFIDGDRGVLNYRGYPIEQLAERSTYLETAYLILHGELPRKSEYEAWLYNITHHTMVHENIKELMVGFRYDAHPMGMLISTVAALSTFYPEAKHIRDRNGPWRCSSSCTPTTSKTAPRRPCGGWAPRRWTRTPLPPAPSPPSMAPFTGGLTSRSCACCTRLAPRTGCRSS